ncbi:hypothetical protein DERP_002873, partial [Dermatophagoides pteronyssinus]
CAFKLELIQQYHIIYTSGVDTTVERKKDPNRNTVESKRISQICVSHILETNIQKKSNDINK